MKILIGTDGSEFSKAAVDQCYRIFADSEDKVFKVIAVTPQVVPVATEPFAVSAEYYQRLINDARDKAKRDLDDALSQIRGHFLDSNITVTGEVLEGPPAQMLMDSAKEWGADLIVVGSHGLGFWGRVLLGSVSSAVVHHAECPVLVVRTGPGDNR